MDFFKKFLEECHGVFKYDTAIYYICLVQISVRFTTISGAIQKSWIIPVLYHSEI